MAAGKVGELEIIQALHRVPLEQWPDVLRFLEAMETKAQRNGSSPIQIGTDLRDSDLIGIWADRTDIEDNRKFARQLREQGSQR